MKSRLLFIKYRADRAAFIKVLRGVAQLAEADGTNSKDSLIADLNKARELAGAVLTKAGINVWRYAP